MYVYIFIHIFILKYTIKKYCNNTCDLLFLFTIFIIILLKFYYNSTTINIKNYWNYKKYKLKKYDN